jgi:hypothetical protein
MRCFSTAKAAELFVTSQIPIAKQTRTLEAKKQRQRRKGTETKDRHCRRRNKGQALQEKKQRTGIAAETKDRH